jgi:multimeric flavodoxin WrbA
MKILCVCGSFREESNTNKIVQKVAESSGCEFELVLLSKVKVKPCTGCLTCMTNQGQCVIEDGMQQLYEKMLAANAIVLGAPTYRMDISGGAKCFIDRTIALYFRGIGPDAEIEHLGKRPLAGKPAVAVTTTAGVGHERAEETIRIYFEINKMNVVAELPEVVGINDVDDMPEVLQRAEKAGQKLGAALREAGV